MVAQAAPDQIDAAIARADAASPEVTVEMTPPIQVTLATGRPVLMQVPADASDLELLSLIDAVLKVGDQIRARRQATAPSPIAIARRLPGRL